MNLNFEQISQQALHLLQTIFGYQSFRENQLDVIKSVINGQDNLVIMPTGGGKSLCYQIPALMLDGTAVIVSPLIALMKDQVDKLASYDISVAYLNSTQSYDEQKKVIDLYLTKKLKLIYVAPERLFTHSFLSVLNQVSPSFIAIDEAHCISQWGHDFRPEYLQIGQLKNQFPAISFLALTATADLHTRNDIISRLQLNEPNINISSFDRPNIQYTIVDQINLFEQVSSYILNKKDQSGIVYCSSRAKVEDLATKLRNKKIKVAAYHAGMSFEDRTRVQEQFLQDEITVIVATVAFGMGVSKADVRFVIHASMPRTIESYYQETGRAGRDGLPAEAILFFTQKDAAWYNKILEDKADEFHTQVEKHKLDEMTAFTQSQICRRIVLLNYFDEHRTNACNNCDICLYPLKKYDGLIDAQKVLSCVYKVGQQHGVQYVVDVLRGSNKAKIKDNKHNELSVYGIGKSESEQYWVSVIRQLIHLGYLRQNLLPTNSLMLTQNSKVILKGEIALSLVKPRTELIKNIKKNHYSRTLIQSSMLSYTERKLYDRLITVRNELAKQKNIAPYLVLTNQSILDMTKRVPTSEYEFSSVYGVGEIKSRQYSKHFIDEINQFYLDND